VLGSARLQLLFEPVLSYGAFVSIHLMRTIHFFGQTLQEFLDVLVGWVSCVIFLK